MIKQGVEGQDQNRSENSKSSDITLFQHVMTDSPSG